jgi:hypothetical protein
LQINPVQWTSDYAIQLAQIVEGISDGQGFGALETLDDDGNHFLEFRLFLSWGGTKRAHWRWFIRKKHKEGEEHQRLTDAERLGIDLTDEEVKAI